MEKYFIDTKAVSQDEKEVSAALKRMGTVAKFLIGDGLNVNAKDLWDVTQLKRTIESFYLGEVQERMKTAPKYRLEAEMQAARDRAALCPVLPNFDVLKEFKAENFSIDPDTCDITLNADVEKAMRSRHTKNLTHEQIKLIAKIEEYRDCVKQLNELLDKANVSRVETCCKYLFSSGEVDIESIAYRVHI